MKGSDEESWAKWYSSWRESFTTVPNYTGVWLRYLVQIIFYIVLSGPRNSAGGVGSEHSDLRTQQIRGQDISRRVGLIGRMSRIDKTCLWR